MLDTSDNLETPPCFVCGQPSIVSLYEDEKLIEEDARCLNHLTPDEQEQFDSMMIEQARQERIKKGINKLKIDPLCFICGKPGVGSTLLLRNYGIDADNPKWISYCKDHKTDIYQEVY